MKTEPKSPGLLLVFLCFAIPYFLLMSGYDTTEGLDDYKLARSIVRTGDLGLPTPQGPIYDRGPDGRFYLAHEIGNPLAMIPAVALGEVSTRLVGGSLPLDRSDRLSSFLACLNSVLLVALTVTCAFWVWNALLGLSAETSLGAATALGFGTMLFPYAKTGTDLVLTSFLILLTLALAWSNKGLPSAKRSFLIGFLLAFAFITRPTAALFVPGILGWMIYVAWTHGRSLRRVFGTCITVGMPLLVALVWQGWYNHLRTGDAFFPPMLLPRYAVGNTFEGANPLYALVSILVSPGRSLFLFSPVLIFGLLGFRAFWKGHRSFAVSLLAVIAPYFIFHFLWKHWSGHWGWGPRLHLPLVALLFLPAALWLREVSRQRRTWNIVLALAIVLQIAAVWNNWQFRTAVLTSGGASLHDLTWNIGSNPILDAFSNVLQNLQRMYGLRQPYCLEGSSPLHCQAANTIDIWWANLPGQSRKLQSLGLAIVVALGLFNAALWRKLASSCRSGVLLAAGP